MNQYAKKKLFFFSQGFIPFIGGAMGSILSFYQSKVYIYKKKREYV